MEGVYPFRKYIMQRVEDVPVRSIDPSDENILVIRGILYRRIIYTFKYIGDGGSWRLPVSEYKRHNNSEVIELDTGKVDPKTGSFMVRKLK